MASHSRKATPKAREGLEVPALQVAEPMGVTPEPAPPDRPRKRRDETVALKRNSIRARRARIRSTSREDGKPKPPDVLSGVSESELEADVARFLDSLR